MQHRLGKWTFGVAAFCGLATGVVAQGRRAPLIKNYVAPGNLESKYDPGCIALDKASPQYNPVDLFKAVHACVAADRYDDAYRLYSLAKLYGRYDMLRVADATAHQAITVAQMEVLGDVTPQQQEKFTAAAKAMIDDPPKHKAYCVEVERIGPPSYFPRYMLQHGMSAFIGRTGDGLISDFDAKVGWTKALTDYLKCPAK